MILSVMSTLQVFHELGLTGYGETGDYALTKVKRMLASAVQAHRDLGSDVFVAWLNRSGVQWWPASQYDGPISVEMV